MKKLIALILAGLMLFAFAACGTTTDTNNDGEETKAETQGEQNEGTDTPAGIEAPVDILTAVWSTYDEDHKFFAMGGDMANPVDNAPGAYSLADMEAASSQLVCSADTLAMVDSAAALFHGMNLNTFTGAAYHIKDGSDAAAFITAAKNDIQNNQWMCGFPEKLLVAEITSEYVVVVFGNGEAIDYFNTQLAAQYSSADITVEAIG